MKVIDGGFDKPTEDEERDPLTLAEVAMLALIEGNLADVELNVAEGHQLILIHDGEAMALLGSEPDMAKLSHALTRAQFMLTQASFDHFTDQEELH